MSATIVLCMGCSLTKVPYTEPRCKIQAHIDQGFANYVSKRFEKGSTPRVAIIPFDVAVNFSPSSSFNPELHYGLTLARLFKQNMLAQGDKVIVEIFDRSNWQGKKMDFLTGDLISLKQARDAGYDFLVTGYMDDILEAETLTIHSKIIDTENSTTIWYGTSTSMSPERPTKDLLNFLSRGIYPKRDDVLHFNQRTEGLVSCTIQRVYSDQKVEE